MRRVMYVIRSKDGKYANYDFDWPFVEDLSCATFLETKHDAEELNKYRNGEILEIVMTCDQIED